MPEMGAESQESRSEVERCAATLKLRFGLAVRGLTLAQLLGYRSLRSYQRALARGEIKVKLHPIPHGVGKCATTAKLAKWLVESGKDWKKLVEDVTTRSNDVEG